MKKIFFCGIFLILTNLIFGQYQTFEWLIGEYNQISFKQATNLNEQYPKVFQSNHKITTNNSSFSYLSNLIYYTNEDTVFDISNSSIKDLYYENLSSTPFIFTGDTMTGGIINSYSFVLGQTGAANGYELLSSNNFFDYYTPEASGLSSKMAVTYDNNGYITVATHLLASDNFVIFSNSTGFLEQYYTKIGGYYGEMGSDYDYGYMKFSPQASYLAVSSPGMNELVVYSYESIGKTLHDIAIYYDKSFNAIEFASGLDNYLYAADDHHIYQITFNDAMGNIFQEVGYSPFVIKSMQLGPDGKIYVAKDGDNYLGVIQNPEIRGLDCFYEDKVITLPTISNGTLPAFPSNYFKTIPLIRWYNTTSGLDTMFVDEQIYLFVERYIPENVFWDFGDGTTSTDINAYHTYSDAGIYELKVKLFFAENSFAPWDSLLITKKIRIYPKEELEINVSPKYLTLCDTLNYFPIEVDYTNVANITWYSENGFYATNTNSILAKQPGNYIVSIYDNSNVYTDTAYITYQKCDEIYLNINYDESQVCSGTIQFNASISPNASPCQSYITPEMFNYVWDMGDGNHYYGTGVQSVKHTYSSSGEFLVKLTVTDVKNCEHLFQTYISVITLISDTITIDIPRNTSADIVLDITNQPFFQKVYLENNQFEQSSQIFLQPYTEISDEFYVSQGVISRIADINDFAFFINFAYRGNFSIKLVSPESDTIYICDVYSDSVEYVCGHPAEIAENYFNSLTNTYVFKSTGEDINLPLGSNTYPLYYSPDNNLVRYNYFGYSAFNYLPSKVYKIHDYTKLHNCIVPGTWKLLFYGQGFYGNLSKWGLILNKQYYKNYIQLSEFSATDQNGNNYTMASDSTVKLNNIDASAYILNCNLKYGKSLCSYEKTMIINVPNIYDVFTPNGDGINDFWHTISLDVAADIYILDKNGRLVASFKNTDFPNGWDGTYNQEAIPSDTYWYIIGVEGKEPIKGNITIIR